MRKNLYLVIGIAAFVVGGLVAREKAIEAAEIVEKFFGRSSEDSEDQQQ